ncbi:MAG: type II toxin-antitoxin system HicB family antitoxin [candidate division SR1 bacterium]|nr:type II toxin-antitoxin system HicB family antitoxin [candidate division SR1 bacterium]
MTIVKPIIYLLKGKKMVNFTALYTKEAEGGYTVEILELPGCVSYGETMEEAQSMIKEAAVGYLEAQKKVGANMKKFFNKETFISSVPVVYEAV